MRLLITDSLLVENLTTPAMTFSSSAANVTPAGVTGEAIVTPTPAESLPTQSPEPGTVDLNLTLAETLPPQSPETGTRVDLTPAPAEPLPPQIPVSSTLDSLLGDKLVFITPPAQLLQRLRQTQPAALPEPTLHSQPESTKTNLNPTNPSL